MTRGVVTTGRGEIWHATTACPYVLKAYPGALGVRTISAGAARNRRPCKWCATHESEGVKA